jgi:ABC-type iron transport system FetAB permease component
MVFCEYKNILGEVNKGIHKYKIFNIAIVDVILTFILAIFVSYLFNINYILTVIILFILGFLLHYIFCVDTTVNMFIYSLYK